MNTQKLRVGIIGVGNISVEHIQSYLHNPRVELYAFCDINRPQLERMAEQFGVKRIFTDKDDLLSLPEVDAVSVCTWNSEHAPCTIAALRAGKHVLCEKPMATTVEDAVAMQKAAEQSGRLLQIGFVRRFGNDCTVLKDYIDNDYLGSLYYAKATYLRRNGNPMGWFGDRSRSGGGPLIDLGVHVIDLTRYLMGNPKPVSVYGATFDYLGNRSCLKDQKDYLSVSATGNDLCDVEDLATALIRYENGAVLSVETSFSLHIKQPEEKIELFGTKGGAKLSPELELFTDLNGYMSNVSLCTPTALSFNGLFQKEIDHFVSCILDNTPCLAPAQDGVEIMRILRAVYDSAQSGHEIMLTSL